MARRRPAHSGHPPIAELIRPISALPPEIRDCMHDLVAARDEADLAWIDAREAIGDAIGGGATVRAHLLERARWHYWRGLQTAVSLVLSPLGAADEEGGADEYEG